MTDIHFHVGHNLAGYLPEFDVACFKADEDTSQEEAARAAVEWFESMATEYADEDDEATQAGLPTDPVTAREHGYDVSNGAIDYGDDAPAMRATVDSILKDDPPKEGQDYGMTVEDGLLRMVSFWLAVVPAGDCEN